MCKHPMQVVPPLQREQAGCWRHAQAMAQPELLQWPVAPVERGQMQPEREVRPRELAMQAAAEPLP